MEKSTGRENGRGIRPAILVIVIVIAALSGVCLALRRPADEAVPQQNTQSGAHEIGGEPRTEGQDPAGGGEPGAEGQNLAGSGEQADKENDQNGTASPSRHKAAAAGDETAFIENEVPVFRSGPTDEKVTLRFYEDMPNIAYINMADYYHLFGPEQEMTFEETGELTDLYTVTSMTGTATADTAEETLASEDMLQFTNLMWINQKGMANEYLDGLPYVRWAQTEYSPVQAPVTYRLGDYGIDVRADEKGVYLPVATLADLYSDLAYHHAFYNGEKVYVQNENVDGKLEDRDPDYLNAFSDLSVRPADLAEFTYNELCFAIDHFYGCPGRELLHTELQEKGLDRALRDYGDMGTETIALLRSTDPAEYLIGMDYLQIFLHDGGHTGLFIGRNYSMFLPAEVQLRYDEVRDEDEHDQLNNALADVFAELYAYQDAVSAREGLRTKAYGKGVTYVKKGDTAVCVFDTFTPDDLSAMSDYLSGRTDELPAAEDAKDPMIVFLDALRRASEDEEVRNLVIDISNNGGGSIDIVVAMASLILGGDGGALTAENTFTGQKSRTQYEIDRNFDGVFDEKDKDVHYDLNFAVLTSKASFSCGNAFPSILKDNGILVMGQQSGGGTCAVQQMATADGFKYQISSARLRILNKDGESIDDGIPVDVDLVGRNEDGTDRIIDVEVPVAGYSETGEAVETTMTLRTVDYTQLYDIDRLSEEMNRFYGGQEERELDDAA